VLKILLVGLGGFVGSVARYGLGGFVQNRAGATFPFGTLAVNVLGCFVIGGLSELAETRGILTPETRAFLVIGVLGGFTTFSAFGNETLNLLRERDVAHATANVLANVVLALAAVWLGRSAAHLIGG
jgi:CrcB protein